MDGHAANVNDFMFSGDGRQAFSGGDDGTAILWDVASGSIIYRLTDHSGPVAHVDITKDGQLGIGASTDGTTILWDLQNGKMIRRYAANPFMSLFSPDKRTALIRELPDHVELWRIDATLDELLTWVHANRYVPELNCEQRTLYRLEPLCGTDATPLPTITG